MDTHGKTPYPVFVIRKCFQPGQLQLSCRVAARAEDLPLSVRRCAAEHLEEPQQVGDAVRGNARVAVAPPLGLLL